MKHFFYIVFISLTLSACEDVVSFNIKENTISQLVVDAWITDEAIEQKVTLTLSQPYFENNTVKPALNATVLLIKPDSSFYTLIDKNNNGVYSFTPDPKTFIKEGENLVLYVKYQTQEYYAVSKLNRVPKIDSVNYAFSKVPQGPPVAGAPNEGYYAQFYAYDPAGEGDTYLIRTSVNDTLRFKPNQFQLAYDAGFSPGSKSDGLLFIRPIRESITRGFFKENSKVKIFLYSLPKEAFFYLQTVQSESQNGGIFATPLSNIPTNIINRNPSDKSKAIGAFFVSKVSIFEFKIDKDKAKKEL